VNLPVQEILTHCDSRICLPSYSRISQIPEIRGSAGSWLWVFTNSRLRGFEGSGLHITAHSQLPDFVSSRLQIFASSLTLKSCITNFINLDVSRVTGFHEFPNGGLTLRCTPSPAGGSANGRVHSPGGATRRGIPLGHPSYLERILLVHGLKEAATRIRPGGAPRRVNASPSPGICNGAYHFPSGRPQHTFLSPWGYLRDISQCQRGGAAPNSHRLGQFRRYPVQPGLDKMGLPRSQLIYAGAPLRRFGGGSIEALGQIVMPVSFGQISSLTSWTPPTSTMPSSGDVSWTHSTPSRVSAIKT
jgi:hypothetical protein